jgi:hypothetical protein
MTLNPWKQVRLLRGTISGLRNHVKCLQKVIATQGEFIALQQVRIDTFLRATAENNTVVDPGPGEYLN